MKIRTYKKQEARLSKLRHRWMVYLRGHHLRLTFHFRDINTIVLGYRPDPSERPHYWAYAQVTDNPHRFHYRIQYNPGCGHHLVPSDATTIYGEVPSQCLGRGGCQQHNRMTLVLRTKQWANLLSAHLESVAPKPHRIPPHLMG